MAELRNILIAPDKFKGSLSAAGVGEAIRRGLSVSYPEARVSVQPLADGGDGSLAVLRSCLELETVSVNAADPLGRPLAATYLRNDRQAFIEVASASGLVLLAPADRNPLLTSTYGTGELIRHALNGGCREFFLLLGGSATNDLGLGILTALGYGLADAKGGTLSGQGADMERFHKIAPPLHPLPAARYTLLCDVTNPPFGPRGATRVYAAQKGADATMLEKLEAGVMHAVQVLEKWSGKALRNLPGGGAAGGIGVGLVAALDAKLQPGFTTLARLTGLEAQIAAADLVITGEGRLDEQSLQGKVVDGVGDLCRKHGKPLHVIAGSTILPEPAWRAAGILSVAAVTDLAENVEDAMANTAKYLEDLARAFDL